MNLTTQELAKLKAVQQGLVKIKPRFDVSLPKNSRFDSTRLLAIVSAELRRTPKILDCEVASIEAAVSLAARLMLEPDSALGYIYFIPYGKTLQVIIGYKGMIELAMRSPHVKSLYAQEVYERDSFEIVLGTEKLVKHVPCIHGARGKLIGVYAIAELDNGVKEIEFMNLEDIENVRSRSKSGNSGPWQTDFGAMARKSVVRRVCKYIPRAVDAHLAVAADEAYERGEMVDSTAEVVEESEDRFWAGVDKETGETGTKAATTISSSLESKLKG